MKSVAMYVGKRNYERQQRVLEDGTVIKASKGIQLLFYCSDWEGEEIEDMGKTRFHTIPDNEGIPKNLPKLGGFAEVSIKENFGQRNDNACKFIKAL